MVLPANIVVLQGNTEPAFFSDKQEHYQQMAHTSKQSAHEHPLHLQWNPVLQSPC